MASGEVRSVLLCTDGTPILVPSGEWRGLVIPKPPEGLRYTQVFGGVYHFVLLLSDGTAVAFGGYNEYGELNIPTLDVGVIYTQADVGHRHTVLLRSDATAVACGSNDYGSGQA